MSITIPVMDFELHTDIASSSVFIDRLATFATACGWTVVEKQNAKAWTLIGGGVYGWTADAAVFPGHFLMLENAYNRQFRLRVYPVGAGIQSHYLYKRGYTAGNTYSTALAAHPAEQTTNSWTSVGTYRNPIPSGTYTNVWFFGNSEALYWVIQFDGDYALTDGMGRIHAFDTASNDYGWIGRTTSVVNATGYVTSITDIKASDKYVGCTLSPTATYGIHEEHYYKRYLTSSSTEANNLVFTNFCRRLGAYAYYSSADAVQGFCYPELQPIQNLHSSRIPLWRREFLYKDSLDNQWFLAGFSHMVHFQNESGNAIGFGLKSGAEEYMCFPSKNRYVDYAWHGFRVE